MTQHNRETLLALADAFAAESSISRQPMADMAAMLSIAFNRAANGISPDRLDEIEQARETIRDALMDSQYLAGVTAGWNAANSDDPEASLARLKSARSGHLRGYAEAKAVIALATLDPTGEKA